jgi:predicted ATPase/DNA-binding winged helix-turn-helix (wHTH) protein
VVGGSLFFSQFRFEAATGRLWRDGDEVSLRPKTAAVLGHLLAHPGDVVTKRELMDAVWPDGFVGDAVLTGCVNELRQVLGDDRRDPAFIATAHRRGYRFVAPVSSTHRASSATGRQDSAFVGREAELAVLDGWWQQARDGQCQVGFVAAQAGVGKSALVDAFVERLVSEQSVLVGWGQCVEQFGEGEAYLPVLDALAGLCRGPDGHQVRAVLDSAAPTWLLQLSGLLDPADADALRLRTVGVSSERMLRELGLALELLTVERPLVLVCEDLHDSDRPTIELLAYLARRREPARLLIVGTYRAAEVVSRSHPLRQVVRDLRARGQCGYLALELLTRPAVATYLTARMAPRRPAEAFVDDLYQRTEGNALFVTTLVGHLLDRGLLVDDGDAMASSQPLDRLGIPDSVAQFIERQVDELAEPDRHLLEAAAAIGVEFPAEAVVAAARYDQPRLQAAEIELRLSALARHTELLVEQDMVEWPDGTLTAQFRFLHALYQEVLYAHLPPARRTAVHRRIGDRLGSGFGSRSVELAAELAMHFELGRNHERAIYYLAHAADTALERCALQESVDYAERALQLLERADAITNRAEIELQLRMKETIALVTLRSFGGPGLDAAYRTVRALCAEVGDPALLCPVLYGLWKFALVRAELADAAELGDELRQLADQHPDPVLELQAHHAAGYNDCLTGRPASAMLHCESVLELYDPLAHRHLTGVYGEDPAVACHQFASLSAWLRGYPDRARHHASESCRLARELEYPSESLQATLIAASTHLLCRDIVPVRELTASLFELCHQYDVAQIWSATGKVVDGWAAAQGGEPSTAVSQIRQGLDELASAGALLGLPCYSSILAEALARAGDAAAAFETATDALQEARRTGETWYEAELVRLRGELMLDIAPNDPSGAEAAFVEALEIARAQEAKSLELRAATSLARLWRSRGQRDDARELLAPIYSWFTEGHDTGDLQAAGALLAELVGSP